MLSLLQTPSKQSFNPYLTSSTSYGYKTAPYQQQQQLSPYSGYQQFHPLTFTASNSPQVAYMQHPSNYAYTSVASAPQFYAQQVPFNQFAFNSAQPINPVVHAAPVASFANSYQTPANSFYYGPQQIHKVPFYNQQPQTFSVASYQPANYHHHVKQISPTSPPSQIIASKPVALEASSLAPTASSHVEHNSHGAVSYSHYSHAGEEKPSAAPLIATQSPQQVYYNQQPQVVYGDYSRHQYPSGPIASNYYPSQGALSYANVPYAHISKIPFGAPPTAAAAASTFIPSIASFPQKISFH